jgi:hypothetical protein
LAEVLAEGFARADFAVLALALAVFAAAASSAIALFAIAFTVNFVNLLPGTILLPKQVVCYIPVTWEH